MLNSNPFCVGTEYKQALAIYLFRHASFCRPEDSDEMKTMYAYSYLVAEKLTLGGSTSSIGQAHEG